MQPDDKYRAFLLGTADAKTQAGIEQAILAGRIDADHLRLVEEDLIDDFVFGRLSVEEKLGFASEFLSSPGRTSMVEFASTLRDYAAQNAPETKRKFALPRLRILVPIPARFLLVSALGCAVLAAMWLGERSLTLHRELTQAIHDNDEHQRLITTLLKEQQERGGKLSPSNALAAAKALEGIPEPALYLSPGLNRGLATVPMIHLKEKVSLVSIVLELPFKPVGTLHEELLNSEGTLMWSQQFSSAGGISNHGITTLVLPAALLANGEYRLRVETDKGGQSEGTATYLFRVRID